MKRISLFTLSALGALLCGISCSQEEPLAGTQPSGEQRPGGPVEVEVQLRNDAVQAARAGEGGAADAGTLAPDPIKEIRIYAYMGDECVGHLFRDNLNIGSGEPFRATMQLTKSGLTQFVAIGNESYGQKSWTLTAETPKRFFTTTGTACQSVYTACNGYKGYEGRTPEYSPMSAETDAQGSLPTVNTEQERYITLEMKHRLARLRIRFRKKQVSGGQPVTVKKIILNNRPRNFSLFGEDRGNCYPNSPSENEEQTPERTLVLLDEPQTVSSTDVSGAWDAWIVDKRIFPNYYGTETGGDGTQPPGGGQGGKHTDYGYYLTVIYNTGDGGPDKGAQAKTWLPKVKANEVIDMSATIVPASGELSVSVTVEDWKQGTDSEISYDGKLSGEMRFPANYPQEEGAYAVAYDNSGKELTLKFLMETPLGARWNANLSNGRDFRLSGTTSGYGLGAGTQSYAEFKVIPMQHMNTSRPQKTELYITLTNINGEPLGEQVIPVKNGTQFPGTQSRVRIQQVSKAHWEELSSGTTARKIPVTTE